MNKKPKVYQNNISKVIHNNQEVFDSSKDSFFILENNQEENIQDVSPMNKLQILLNQPGYIFNKEVIIKTKDKDFKTHIATFINNHIITLDNDIINIDDIKDIKY